MYIHVSEEMLLTYMSLLKDSHKKFILRISCYNLKYLSFIFISGFNSRAIVTVLFLCSSRLSRTQDTGIVTLRLLFFVTEKEMSKSVNEIHLVVLLSIEVEKY
jgi:hypothetical protein